MKNYSFLAATAIVLLAACSPKARIEGTVAGAPGSQIVVRQLDINVYKTLDTVKTDAAGRFRYSVAVQPGEPEFVYLFRDGTKIASLLLEAGDKVTVSADTLGNFEVQGSEESERLRDNELEYSRFLAAMDPQTSPQELYRAYVKHYRASTRYIMENPRSLTVVPVLFEHLDPDTPVFSQHNDALLFRKALDTLKTVYPQSRYVKALESETVRRENAMKMQHLLSNAEAKGYPDLNLPDTKGEKVSLSGSGAKVVLLHFWDSSDAEQKMFNLDSLLPVWKAWHDKGFEIYAVDVNPDKAAWAGVVKAQELPWINVNDGRGAASSAVLLYNVDSVPASFLLSGGTLSSATLKGAPSLENELKKILK